MKLVICEKPSVGAAVAAALGVTGRKDGYIEGNGYLISWCIGHLVQLSEAAAYGEQYKKWSYDSLPILPQEWQYTVAADKGKQFKILKDLMHRADVSEVVNACDAGREGELIFRFVYHQAGCKKPFTRLWISSMERAGNEDTDPDAERRGLGTPATRAAVIEKLVKGGFVERKGKQLFPTKDGTNLVCVLPDSLTSPQLTAAWENNLTQIAKGNADPAAFMQGIEAMAQGLVKTYASVLGEKQELFKTEKTEIGKCPRCKSPVYEGKKNYYCSNKECGFTMWKNDRFFEERKTVFTRSIAAALLKSGKVKVKKLYSPKTGKTYDGTVLLADTGGKYVNYKVTISKDKELE